MTLLSICIPTYNRRSCLINCLNSIKIACKNLNFKFDVCISDNSNYSNSDIIKKYKKFFKIIYHKNKNNIGVSKNMLKVVSLSKSKFAWLLGDDDLVHPYGLKIIKNLFYDEKNKDIDFFYLNSGMLNAKTIFKKKQPYSTNKLPKIIKKFSNYKYEGKIKFMDLMNKNISFDFLGGMYTSIFKRKMWEKSKKILNEKKINDLKIFTSLDNTFPHVKIFSKAFSKSQAYFSKNLVSINLSGIREWDDYYPIVFSIRIPEILDEHRKNGLNLIQYLLLKNYSLRNYLPDLCKIIINKRLKISYNELIFNYIKNIIYPNIYLSPFKYLIKKIK